MSAILEAYWLLAAKRFVDNVCMALDKKIMGAMAHKMQGNRRFPSRLNAYFSYFSSVFW